MTTEQPVVGVVSAGRPQVCASTTIAMLLDAGIEPRNLYVFTPDEGTADLYRAEMPNMTVLVAPHDPYDRSLPTTAHPARGLATARNTALDMLSRLREARWLWWLDDDIASLTTLDPTATKPRARKIVNIADWMRACEQVADHNGATMIGIQPNSNPLNYHHNATLGLAFCIGQCFAVRADTPIRGWLTEKDDYERSLQHFTLGGGVLRVNNVGAVSKVYSGAGGLQLSRTFERSHAEAAWLIERWPSMIRLNAKRTLPVDQGRAELLMRPQPTNIKVPAPRPHTATPSSTTTDKAE
jgi:hypothetical protein